MQVEREVYWFEKESVFDAFRTYGFHSIYALVFRRGDEPRVGDEAVGNRDSGYDLTVRLTQEEVSDFIPRMVGERLPTSSLERVTTKSQRALLRRLFGRG